MSETYTKLFGSITDSTIWLEPDEIRLVWITMLAMADQHGYVGASVPGLAARARVPVDSCREALGKFLSPDPDSRSKEYEGRRIEEADRGWNILNYDRFRDMRDEEVRKEYERKRKRDQREKARRAVVPDSPEIFEMSRDVPQCLPQSAQAEAYTEAKKKREREPARNTNDGETLLERAGRLREELYPAWYAKYRHGARLRLVANSLEFEDAKSLVRTWDDDRLEKLARIVLTTDDPFISSTDRSLKIFALKASWADDRLRQVEHGSAS